MDAGYTELLEIFHCSGEVKNGGFLKPCLLQRYLEYLKSAISNMQTESILKKSLHWQVEMRLKKPKTGKKQSAS